MPPVSKQFHDCMDAALERRALYPSLAIYLTASVCLFTFGHLIGGAILAVAAVRVAFLTGI